MKGKIMVAKSVSPGDVIGKWTVVSVGVTMVTPCGQRQKAALCRCQCGIERMVRWHQLCHGLSLSCGHDFRDKQRMSATKHGEASGNRRTPEYKAWDSMKYRCCNSECKHFDLYGGRGIRVCERWMESFQNFLDDMGRRPSKSYSIDRIDNNGNYEPGNCRWATKRQQSNNRRNTKMVTIKGETKSLYEWLQGTGISANAFYARKRMGWDDARAVSQPIDSQRRSATGA